MELESKAERFTGVFVSPADKAENLRGRGRRGRRRGSSLNTIRGRTPPSAGGSSALSLAQREGHHQRGRSDREEEDDGDGWGGRPPLKKMSSSLRGETGGGPKGGSVCMYKIDST